MAVAIIKCCCTTDQLSSMDETDSIPSTSGDQRSDSDIHSSEISEWMMKALQSMDIGLEVSEESLQMLTAYLDTIMEKVLEEAKSLNGETRELTSLDIHKAIKKLLPGNPGDTLRPYLPSKTKQAWNLDKQSLKGIKRKRQKTALDQYPNK